MNRYEPAEPRSPLPELTQLLTPGTLGFYTHVECTELFASRPDHEDIINIFTLLIAEEQPDLEPAAAYFLTPKPIRIKSLNGWSFGLRRYTALIALASGEDLRRTASVLLCHDRPIQADANQSRSCF